MKSMQLEATSAIGAGERYRKPKPLMTIEALKIDYLGIFYKKIVLLYYNVKSGIRFLDVNLMLVHFLRAK